MPRTVSAQSAVALVSNGHNPQVDELIANSATFAQPILTYLRALVHEAAPDAVEEIKWSRPFFTVNGTNICYIAAFSKHCGFGFWSPEITAMLREEGVDGGNGSGSVGKIMSINDLPPRVDLMRYIRLAAQRARAGEAESPMRTGTRAPAKAPVAMTLEFADALSNSKAASATFEALPPSCRREYLEWVTSAKRPETRERRIAQALAMLEVGKRFNEKYQAR